MNGTVPKKEKRDCYIGSLLNAFETIILFKFLKNHLFKFSLALLSVLNWDSEICLVMHMHKISCDKQYMETTWGKLKNHFNLLISYGFSFFGNRLEVIFFS